jgi:hypothetical protein
MNFVTLAEERLRPRDHRDPPGGRYFEVPSREEIRCVTCGAEADTVHFLPWVTRTREVRFACPRHDPGGYWLPLDGINDGPPDHGNGPYTARVHIYGKCAEYGYTHAVFQLDEAFDRIRRGES